jgi:hypothetical protein
MEDILTIPNAINNQRFGKKFQSIPVDITNRHGRPFFNSLVNIPECRETLWNRWIND